MFKKFFGVFVLTYSLRVLAQGGMIGDVPMSAGAGGITAPGGATGMPLTTIGLEANPLTNCELYPNAGALTALNSQIAQLRAAAISDPSCRAMVSAATEFHAAATPFMRQPDQAPDLNPIVLNGMGQMVGAFNSFMNATNNGSACAGSQLGSQVRQSIGGMAVSIATELTGAPIVGSLVGAIAQHFFRSLQGPNLVAINNNALSQEDRAKKYGCLFRNFSNMFISQCQSRGMGGGMAFMGTGLGDPPNSCQAGVFNSGVVEAQNLASMVMAVVQPGSAGRPGSVSDETRGNLQRLQRSIRETQIAAPDNSGSKSLYEWLGLAGAHFASPGEDGYPRSASLARSLRGTVTELDGMQTLLMNPEAPEMELQQSLTRLQLALQGLQENAPVAAGDLANVTGAWAFPTDRPFTYGDKSGMTPIGTPVMSDKGLSLSVMAYFDQTMGDSYSQARQHADIGILGGTQIQSNFDALFSAGVDNISERDRHQAFNAMMAITQDPIIDHMRSLKGATQTGGGRTTQSICQAHTQLAQNCASLAGAFFYTVGNSARNEQGANMLTDRRARDYHGLCSDYINRGIIPSPFERPAPPEGTMGVGYSSAGSPSCGGLDRSGRLALAESEVNRQYCVMIFQQYQCDVPRRGEIVGKMPAEYCPPTYGGRLGTSR